MFEKTVKNKDGVEKRVVASTQEDLDNAVKAVESESAPTYPDIDNPDHGNMRVQDFAEGKETPADQRAEHFPTSEESKQLSRELAAADSKEERREILNTPEDPAKPADQATDSETENETDEEKVETDEDEPKEEK